VALAGALAVAFTAMLAPAAAAPPADAKLLLVQTESRVEVDAQGNVTAVKTTPQLPADIEAIVDGNLRKLRFEPPMKDGKAVAGVTYAVQDACAAPVDGKYAFAVKYRGNGPSMARSAHPPLYPRGPMMRGIQAEWNVEYTVGADGKGSVAGLKLLSGGGGRDDAEFRKVLKDWIANMPFQPEQLDGQPVATRMSTKVSFVLDNKRRDVKASNEACQLALQARDDDDRAVAIDSPFKPIVATN
jgi:outer membrane biosynthesis protein TonB